MNTPSTSVWDSFSKLIQDGVAPKSLDETHDLLRLLGIVLGQIALLDVATDPASKDTARVAAAKALMDVHESPLAIAERLRRSPFAGLSAQQLQTIVQAVKAGETDLPAVISRVKGSTFTPHSDGSTP
jgi:hypothetical protein